MRKFPRDINALAQGGRNPENAGKMKKNILLEAKRVLEIESQAVREQIGHLDSSFVKSVELICSCPGRIIIMGVGKSGLIGKKIAPLFFRLGIPAISVHPADLFHGDLGMMVRGDSRHRALILGESEELKKVFPILRETGLKTNPPGSRGNSVLARSCDLFINAKIKREACPFNLAPTASTTAMLAWADALALCAGRSKGFKKKILPGTTREGISARNSC